MGGWPDCRPGPPVTHGCATSGLSYRAKGWTLPAWLGRPSAVATTRSHWHGSKHPLLTHSLTPQPPLDHQPPLTGHTPTQCSAHSHAQPCFCATSASASCLVAQPTVHHAPSPPPRSPLPTTLVPQVHGIPAANQRAGGGATAGSNVWRHPAPRGGQPGMARGVTTGSGGGEGEQATQPPAAGRHRNGACNQGRPSIFAIPNAGGLLLMLYYHVFGTIVCVPILLRRIA